MRVYRAIVSDIDGTIAPVAYQSDIHPRVIAAVKSLTASGFPFCLAASKPCSRILPVIEALGVTSPVVADNGAVIYDPITRKEVWSKRISLESSHAIIDIFRASGKLIKVSDGWENVDLSTVDTGDTLPTKYIAVGFLNSEAKTVIEQIERSVPEVRAIATSSYEGPEVVDICVTHADATKRQAVHYLCEYLHIQPGEVIAIGDHYNDIPLFEACDFKVAMRNAVPELQALADYIAPSVDEDGIVDVIDRFVLPVHQ